MTRHHLVGTWLALAAGTLISEDLTCVVAGMLIARGVVEPWVGTSACAAGIYAGDLALYAIGRLFAARAREWPVVRRYMTRHRPVRFHAWFTSHAATIILASRFLPGTRLPLYVTSGVLGAPFSLFAIWTLIAVALWTPILVLASAQFAAVSVVGLLLAWRIGLPLLTPRRRQRLVAAISRLWRWEFWPMWLFYTPVAIWVGWLIVRYRGVRAISAANPGMPDGGFVGESKHEILSHLPSEWTIPSVRIDSGSDDARLWCLLNRLTNQGWPFPLVFKPDVGQRGMGVKVVRGLEDARAYLAREKGPVMVQPYHEGPFEAGVFYYRFPGASRGRILSITDKHFPFAIGDGHSTLEDLIWADARLRMQAATFLRRHSASRNRVLATGERFRLAIAGNHAQGTLFRDGRHLITPALEDRIDSIAWSYGGFFIGRFDIRYTNVDQFVAGENFAIVELNGASAESTNVYDPNGSLINAYRQLFHQWSLVFAVGAANLQNGTTSSGIKRVLELVRAHVSSKPAFETSD